jgi:cell division protein FtsX
LQPKNFVFPFLAHALGTLVGALTAHLIAASHRSVFAYTIGVLNLVGGIAASFMIPAPTWFIAVDLLVAYLPMAWLASKLGRTLRPDRAAVTRSIAT